MLAGALIRELEKRGHETALIQLPLRCFPKEEILKSYLMWRLTNLDHTYDMRPIHRVIALKFPAYAISHPHKTTWLIHQLRQAYDLYDTEYSFFDNTPEDHELRGMISHMDRVTINESERIYSISANVAHRLRKYNRVHSQVLYPPPPLDGRFYHDHYGDYVLCVSRLHHVKRVDPLIHALRHTRTPVRCIIAGRGPDMERLQKLAARNKVADRVDFLGFVPDEEVIDLYARALAVYYAPVDEDYGFATIEGMKSRKPILTLDDSGGVLEFVKQGVTGLIAAAGAPELLAECMDTLYENRDMAKRLGSAGQEIVAPITWDSTIERLLDA
jgi:glycosyltransferase involved in cell wall biosynthesis